MISALIFDLDGTLFDSSKANINAYSCAFAEVGVQFDEHAYTRSFGLRFPEMMDAIAPQTEQTTRDRIKQLKAIYYEKSLDLVRPNHGLLSLLESSAGKFKTALVTTASKANVLNLLAHFSVNYQLFNIIITGEDVKNGKPDPECYITALERLNCGPDEACIFEDSDVGVAAAEQAGARVIRVVI